MTSLWNGTTQGRGYPAVSDELRVDVAVVGGGIFGLSAAYLLKRAGKSVAVIEARQVGAQVTGGSTGKVTSQHGLHYHDMVQRFGGGLSQAYADANRWAIDEIARIVAEEHIECDFERRDAYLVARGARGAEQLRQEAAAATSLGLPASLTSTPPTAQPVQSALRFAEQAQFHPRKYVEGLAAAVDGDGSAVFEHSIALDVQRDGPHRVATKDGAVLADDVVIATNLPFLDRGGHFARAYPRAHLGIAAQVAAEHAPEAMFLCVDGPPHSYRSWRSNGESWLIAIGEGFVPGHVDDLPGMAVGLENELRQSWPIEEVEFRWMTEDYHAADRQPFAGPLTPRSQHLYTATGFGAWGLTNGTAAARVVADQILGQQQRWSNLYDPARLRSTVTPRFLRRNAHVARHWIEGRLTKGEKRHLSGLAHGEGAILQTENGKLAVYRDAAGSYHAFSPYCPHMQCLLSWNGLEKTWDCACHGSRFEAEGDLLHGPARQALKPAELP